MSGQKIKGTKSFLDGKMKWFRGASCTLEQSACCDRCTLARSPADECPQETSGRESRGKACSFQLSRAPDASTRPAESEGVAPAAYAAHATRRQEAVRQFHCQRRHAEQAVRLLMQDCVIAVPTDTVYGLAGVVQSEDAVEKLYKIKPILKRRDAAKPIAICVSCISKMEKWADTSILAPALLQCILPGPFTIVLKRSKTLNAKFNPGIPNIGIRIPQDRFIVEVVKKFGERIALTSANSSGKQSAIAVEEFSHLWQYVDTVFDAGKNPQEIRTGSTVVDLSGHGSFKIIRAGLLCDALRHKLFQFKLLERGGIGGVRLPAAHNGDRARTRQGWAAAAAAAGATRN
ncbi:threonylcarbamoyl-AMP synthase-like [Schistocerca cancellata]|uniref:threonylcarbamoyl-AMP synthase-like n=1 Tax=Schistocerca cancellata TaxID=274614 RepID=UPI002119AC4C|nr:threonylcarbamoyl-AMP synthase-like [Schistocerca cancellata]